MVKVVFLLIITSVQFLSLSGQKNNSVQSGSKKQYLSDIDPSYALLEKIQMEAYNDGSAVRHVSPPDPVTLSIRSEMIALLPFFDDDAILSAEAKKSREAYNEFWRKSNEQSARELATMILPTRYENANWYAVVSRLNKRLLAVISKQYPDFKQRIIFGTIPTSSVNAATLKVPGSTDILVLFNEDLFNASYVLTKVLIQTFSWQEHSLSYKRDHVRQQAKDPKINQEFRKIMLWYLNTSSRPTEFYPLEPGQMKMTIVLTRSMEIFALAHEYSHAILGHLIRDEKKYANNWVQEIQADNLGFLLMFSTLMDSGDQEERAFGRWGALLMLNAMDIFERATITAETGEIPPGPEQDALENQMIEGVLTCLNSPNSDICKKFLESKTPSTHPPTWLRMDFLRNLMKTEPSLAPIMNDEWDFGYALIIAGHALLLDNSSFFKPIR